MEFGYILNKMILRQHRTHQLPVSAGFGEIISKQNDLRPKATLPFLYDDRFCITSERRILLGSCPLQ